MASTSASTPRSTPLASRAASRSASPRRHASLAAAGPSSAVPDQDELFGARPSGQPQPHDEASTFTLSLPQIVEPAEAEATPSAGPGGILVISGGSGFNSCVGATPGATFAMPISDDGGSSSEIIRVLGGPSLGDLRSRLVRLIPLSTHPPLSAGTPPTPPSNDALHALLSYRLPSTGSSRDIKLEWLSLVEGRHALWHGIEPERKECVRGFLVLFQSEILRRANRNFNLRGGSIGNFFLSAAQKFFRSIQTAIFLFSATTQMQARSAGRVLPVINTNHTATIAAELESGEVIVGQCEISHPARPRTQRALPDSVLSTHAPGTPSSAIFDPFWTMTNAWTQPAVGHQGDGLAPQSDDEGEQEEDEPSTGLGNLAFRDVEEQAQLPSPISRIFYVNAYRQEVRPTPSPEFISQLHQCSTLIYSCGSLWTSIMPCLSMRGVGGAIARSHSLRHKVLLLNTSHDRETDGLDAIDFLNAITRSLNRADAGLPAHSVSDYVTHVVFFAAGSVVVDVAALEALGVQAVEVASSADGEARFDESIVREALQRITGAPQ